MPYMCCYRCWMNVYGWRNTFPHTHTLANTHAHECARVLMNCRRIVGSPIGSMPDQKKIVRCHWRHRQAVDDYDVEEDLPNALKLLGEMNNNVKQVSDLVENMLQRVKNGELTTEYGLSFLEIKYHMLLTYLINLTYVVLRKCSGVYTYLLWGKGGEKWFISNEQKSANIDLFWFFFQRTTTQANKSNAIHPSTDWLKFELFWRRSDQLTTSYAIKSINWLKLQLLVPPTLKIQSISGFDYILLLPLFILIQCSMFSCHFHF